MLIKFLDGTSREIAILRGADLSSADLRRADLRSANLRSANLRSANLSDADLSRADLRRADLRSADLRRADLRSADLRDANLSDADLSDADLSDADLRGANLPEGYRIARIDFGGWSVTVTPTKTAIGCQEHGNDLWLKADPRWIATLDAKATEWWARHGAVVQAAIRSVQS